MAIVPLSLLALTAFAQSDGQVRQVDDKLTIEFHQQRVDLESGKAVYYGGVKATYGPTVVYSDKLELTLGENESRGLAEGNIRLIDPDGTLTADKLEFDWKNNTGEALNVVIKSYRMTIKAKSLKIRPGNWTFGEVSATSCDRSQPIYLVRAPRIDVQPGKRAIVRNVELQILGSTFLKVPYIRQSLDKRISEFAPPRLNFDEEGKASASLTNSFYIAENTVLGGVVKLADGLYPKYGLSVTRSFIGSDSTSGSFVPESEINESSKHSFFDSVTVTNPEAEKSYLGQRRNSLTVGTYWNQRTPGRLVNNTINRPWEAVYQLSGGSEGLDALAQVRLHNIGRVGEGTYERAVASAAVSLPAWPISRNAHSYTRLSGIAYMNPDGQYGWGQAQVGVVYSPLKDVFLGGAYGLLGEFGDPLFQSDRPYSKSSLNFRIHWGLGPTKIGFLAKYDFGQKRWYDDEFSFSQVAGCMEPYIVWRRFPNEVSFGIGFRLDEFFDRLSRRQPIRRP